MAIIYLETSGGFVSYATIHDMQPEPEIVCWGERLFVRDAERCMGHSKGGVHRVYTEGLLVLVADPTPRKDP